MNEQVENLKTALSKIKSKDFGIYFYTIDTKGNPVASVANIYEHVKLLNELGYRAYVLHQQNDYKLYEDENGMGIANWLGEEYANLPHASIEAQQLQVGPSDFLIIPEAFGGLIKETQNFPCKRIVLLQAYEYMLEDLGLGESWQQFGVNDVITTTNTQKEYVESVFRGTNTHVLPVGIPEYFTKNDKPKKPIVAISSRDKREILKLVKVFYQKYPHYRFITFRDMSGMSRETFANELKDSFLGVWVDDLSGFGTFPIECMKTNTPVVGKIPRMVPEWMGHTDENGNTQLNENGVWTSNLNALPDIVATMVGLYLEGGIPQNLTNGMEETASKYTTEELRSNVETTYTNIINQRQVELETLLNRVEESTNSETEVTNK
tara:strand:- start:534 stop:1667 length:1134 start_codon:yes stop_codon:yes gene_type:complete